MTDSIEFSRRLIKGKIAEVIFEQMFRNSKKFTIFHFGYEYTLPELAQFQHLAQVKAVTDNIKNAPDFILISQDKEEVFLVEVKYRSLPKADENANMAQALISRWDPSWLFIASPDGFYFDACNRIINNKGVVRPLALTWVDKKVQQWAFGTTERIRGKSLTCRTGQKHNVRRKGGRFEEGCSLGWFDCDADDREAAEGAALGRPIGAEAALQTSVVE